MSLLGQSRQLSEQLRTVASKKQEDAAWALAAAAMIDRLIAAFEKATRRTIESYDAGRAPVPEDIRQAARVRAVARAPSYQDVEEIRSELADLKSIVESLNLESATECQHIVRGEPE